MKKNLLLGIIAMLLLVIMLLLLNKCSKMEDDNSPVVDSPGVLPDEKETCSAFWVDKTKEWICSGTCELTGKQCQLIPTNVVPEDGFFDENIVPDCGCLSLTPGDCAFYDADGGGGSMDLTCSGNCDTNFECNQYATDGYEYCECKEVDPDACGWKEGQFLMVLPGQDICAGYCDNPEEYCQIVYDEQSDTESCECMWFPN